MQCGSGAEGPVAMTVNMGQGQALEGRPFDGSPLSRAGSLQDLALLKCPLLLRAGKVVSRASGVALGNAAGYRLLRAVAGVGGDLEM
jgi:hypothetical protein